jgi:hypothetical protein
MGLIHSRASKKRDRAAAALAGEQRKGLQAERKDGQWDEILASFEAGETVWDDLTRLQKMSMPIGYQLKCKAAQRRHAKSTP